MELVEGAPIAVPDSQRKQLYLAVQIADGLAAAHDSDLTTRSTIFGLGREFRLGIGLGVAA